MRGATTRLSKRARKRWKWIRPSCPPISISPGFTNRKACTRKKSPRKTMTMAGAKWNEAVQGLQRSFAAGGIQGAPRWRLTNYLSRTKTAYVSLYRGAILYTELGYRD